MATRADMAVDIARLGRLLDDARARVDRLEIAVRWALGETVPGPEFKPRGIGDPPYWWRRELRARAGMGR